MDFKMAINFEPIDAEPSYRDVSLISGPSPTRIRSKLNFFGEHFSIHKKYPILQIMAVKQAEAYP